MKTHKPNKTLDNPDLTVSKFMENGIGLQRVQSLIRSKFSFYSVIPRNVQWNILGRIYLYTKVTGNMYQATIFVYWFDTTNLGWFIVYTGCRR